VRKVEAGEVLFHAGGADYDFFVIESGAVAVIQDYGTENRVVAVHGRHRFLGELSLLTGSRPGPGAGNLIRRDRAAPARHFQGLKGKGI
jgi:CRP-like cAMP-binding protein